MFRWRGESAASTVSASNPRGSRGRETMGWVRGSGHRLVRCRSEHAFEELPTGLLASPG
jgi:hypothetical protein